jgi:hypothetical protein
VLQATPRGIFSRSFVVRQGGGTVAEIDPAWFGEQAEVAVAAETTPWPARTSWRALSACVPGTESSPAPASRALLSAPTRSSCPAAASTEGDLSVGAGIWAVRRREPRRADQPRALAGPLGGHRPPRRCRGPRAGVPFLAGARAVAPISKFLVRRRRVLTALIHSRHASEDGIVLDSSKRRVIRVRLTTQRGSLIILQQELRVDRLEAAPAHDDLAVLLRQGPENNAFPVDLRVQRAVPHG